MDERPAIVVNLPTTVRGFVYHDADGEYYIVVNARLTREANRRTWRHEKRHVLRGDLYNGTYHEYKKEDAK